jgi:hypothetical protein
LDHVEAVNLTEAGNKVLSSISHPVLRQSVRDYFVNQQFRRDIFAKGYRRLTPLEQSEAFRNQAFVLLMNADDVPMKVTGSLGEATLQEEIYRPAIQALADNSYAPKTIGQLATDPRLSAVSASQLVQVLLVLTGARYVHPAQEPSRRARANCAAMNRFVWERTRSSPDISFLASPVSASGVPISMFQQLFLLAGQQGRLTLREQATFVWDLLRSQGRQVVKDGAPLKSPEENLDELTKHATEFAEKRLPVLKALGVV